MLTNDPAIAYWVMQGIEGGRYIDGMTAIGEIKNGKLIAGICFEMQNKNNLWGHLRIDSSPSKSFWTITADFIFNQAGCKRFTATVEADNTKAIQLNKHIGFVIEATLKDAGKHGDLHIMTLWKDNCRFLKWKMK
jgi:RimJ/RimL family protein N-acetyltransferase